MEIFSRPFDRRINRPDIWNRIVRLVLSVQFIYFIQMNIYTKASKRVRYSLSRRTEQTTSIPIIRILEKNEKTANRGWFRVVGPIMRRLSLAASECSAILCKLSANDSIYEFRTSWNIIIFPCESLEHLLMPNIRWQSSMSGIEVAEGRTAARRRDREHTNLCLCFEIHVRLMGRF